MPTPSSIPTARAPSADAGAPLWVPVSVGLVGLAGVAVGITAALLALEEKGYAEDHCSPTQRLCDPVGAQATRNGRMFSMVSASTLGLGALAVVGAVAIYRSSDSRTQIAGSVTPLGGGQLRFTHRW